MTQQQQQHGHQAQHASVTSAVPEGGLGEGGRAGHWARVALLELCFTEEVRGGVESGMRGCARCGGMHGATLLELCFSEVRGGVESGMRGCARCGGMHGATLLELCFTEEVSGGVDSEMRGCARCGGMHGATLLELCFSEEVRGSVESGMCRCVQKCRGCEVLGRGVMPNFLLELCNA